MRIFQFLIFLFIFYSIEGLASGFTIYPNRVELNESKYRQTFKLVNDDEGIKVIQIRLFKWSQKDGLDIKEPSKDLIIMPPVIKLPKGVEKIVRIGFRQPMVADSEITYRVEFKEIIQKEQTTGISLAFKQSVPIYYSYNEKWKSNLSASEKYGTDEMAEFVLSNSGRRHSIIKNMKIVDQENQTTIWQSDNAFAVLSNASRKFTVASIEPNKKYNLEIKTKNGDYQQTLLFEK